MNSTSRREKEVEAHFPMKERLMSFDFPRLRREVSAGFMALEPRVFGVIFEPYLSEAAR